jgi:hypothetical protein
MTDYGTYGEEILVPAQAVVPCPPDVSSVTFAAVWMQYLTACGGLVEFGVVGVVSGRINDLAVAEATGSLPQNINFAIKSAIVREFLDANQRCISDRVIRYEARPGPGPQDNPPDHLPLRFARSSSPFHDYQATRTNDLPDIRIEIVATDDHKTEGRTDGNAAGRARD